MAISYVKDDITNAQYGVIAHCVNCQRVMGSGVALAIKTKWPFVYEQYMNQPKGEDMLSTTHVFAVERDIFVANCYGQVNFGSDGKRYADLEAIEKCLADVCAYASLMDAPVHIPYKMASDRAGLDWDSEVYPIIERLNSANDIDINIWVYN